MDHDVSIEFDDRGLAAAGVRPDVPVNADEKHLSLASALDKLLGPLGLSYVVDDEVILITATKRDAPGPNQDES